VRRRALILASAASATVIIGGWQLGVAGSVTTQVAQGTANTVGSSGSSSGTTDAAGSTTGSDTGTTETGTTDQSSTGTQTTSSAAGGTYVGTTVSTRFGDVQVQVTISDGAITDVTALQLTDDEGRSVQISNRAAPILRDEVLQAQTASVSMVSGATYTSAAYLQSLQAALDQAGF
jgi:uncharacterized protein with FMN-binding domain